MLRPTTSLAKSLSAWAEIEEATAEFEEVLRGLTAPTGRRTRVQPSTDVCATNLSRIAKFGLSLPPGATTCENRSSANSLEFAL